MPIDGSKGSKRTLSAVLKYLEHERKLDVQQFWQRIHEIVKVVTPAMARALLNQVTALPTHKLWPGGRLGTLSKTNCFHLVGLDVMLDENGRAFLLELNCNPSLAIDAVYPLQGPHPQLPPLIPTGTEDEARVRHAVAMIGVRKTVNGCRCTSHTRVHLHWPSRCDLQAKLSAVTDALLIIKRDMLANRTNIRLAAHELAHSTSYATVIDSDAVSEDKWEAELLWPGHEVVASNVNSTHRPTKCIKRIAVVDHKRRYSLWRESVKEQQLLGHGGMLSSREQGLAPPANTTAKLRTTAKPAPSTKLVPLPRRLGAF